jgi:hypothetical protein
MRTGRAARVARKVASAGTFSSAAPSSEAPSSEAPPSGALPAANVGLVSRLWPTDKPIYKRPAAIIGGAALAGLLGWLWYAHSKKTKSTAIVPAS